MDTFTYHRHAPALHSLARSAAIGAVLELVGIAAVVYFVPGKWKLVAAGIGLAALVGSHLYFSALLRRGHSIREGKLHLAYGRFRIDLPLTDIVSAGPTQSPPPAAVPVGTLLPGYDAGEDALFLLADRGGLVALELRAPREAHVPGSGSVQFTRVLLSLDDPLGFLERLGFAAEPDRASSEPDAAQPLDRAPQAETLRIAPVHVPVEARHGAAIELSGLTRRFGGFTAVQGIDLIVRPGEILAFLGSNGAGKTTTIRMMVGLLRPSAGRVCIAGRDVWADGPDARRGFGYVPDIPLLHEGLTAREFLRMMGGLYGLPAATTVERAEEALNLLQMERWADHLIRNFSLGMKRKMAIAGALLHRPPVLLLDEVTNGLDPRAARDVKNLVAATARMGTAVFITTHILDVVQELADRIAVIERGRIQAVGTLEELRGLTGLPGAGLEEVFLALTERSEVPA